jgi:hypothetical protein
MAIEKDVLMQLQSKMLWMHIQAEKGYNQALINYNITLVRYDLLRNKIFDKFNIKIDEVLNKKASQFK